uniref:Uncharacterized protein n=1 Tax=Oryza sativa subsp. japonica TaxID=39947 RepID=Q652L7_ORYSJ|nr:hypothetical protein [Oryza sativa Japonica Group]
MDGWSQWEGSLQQHVQRKNVDPSEVAIANANAIEVDRGRRADTRYGWLGEKAFKDQMATIDRVNGPRNARNGTD